MTRRVVFAASLVSVVTASCGGRIADVSQGVTLIQLGKGDGACVPLSGCTTRITINARCVTVVRVGERAVVKPAGVLCDRILEQAAKVSASDALTAPIACPSNGWLLVNQVDRGERTTPTGTCSPADVLELSTLLDELV